MTTSKYIGIIGGSGLYSIAGFQQDQKLAVKTPYGDPSSLLTIGKLNGAPVVFLARHGDGHIYNPSEINYRANIWAMKKVGVSAIFSVSAVGSLKGEIHPGHLLVVDQFYDRTRFRPSTFFEKGLVAHVSMAYPVSGYLRGLLIDACREAGVTVHEKGTYVCMEGPQFSSQAESHSYRNLGASIIGMTNMPEAKLAREAEIDYATLALVTDFDCWHPDHDHVTTDQVVAVVKANVKNAQKVLSLAVKKFDFSRKLESEGILQNAIMTHRECVSKEVVERLEPIVGKYFC